MTLATICLVAIVILLAGIAGFVGWTLSHKQYSDGFLLGYSQGREEMSAQMAAAAAPKKPDHLRPIK